MPPKSELKNTSNEVQSKTADEKESLVGISKKLTTSSPKLTPKTGTDKSVKVILETQEIVEKKIAIETAPQNFDTNSAKDLSEATSNLNLVKPDNSNTTTKELKVNPETEEEVDEDVREMQTIWK